MSFFIAIASSVLLKTTMFKILNDSVFIDSFVIQGGLEIYLLSAVLFMIINFFIRPILSIITLPIHFVTLGVSGIFLNGFMLKIWEMIINWFLPGSISIEGFFTYVLIGTMIMMVSSLIHWITK